MLKMGFRGERKRILTPSLSQGEGECGDGKSKETSPPYTYSVLVRRILSCAWLPSKGNVVTKKGKLGNERIRK